MGVGLLLVLLALFSGCRASVPIIDGERHIVVVTASYNNREYYKKNLDSVFSQQYKNWHQIYIDDCSTDKTEDLVEQYVHQHEMEDHVKLIKNPHRLGALHNQYDAIHSCLPTDIIIILDGDDWFSDAEVLSYINSVYADNSVWLTYGQFVQYPTGHRGWNVKIPPEVVYRNSFREYTHAPSHLRTFYAGLFQKIQKEDLLYNGDFFRMTGDIAAMFPMIEMARLGHFRFISKVLMVYNIGNPLNDHKVIEGLQKQIDLIIRSRPKYNPIHSPF